MADFKQIYFNGDEQNAKFHCDPYGIYMFAGEDCSLTALECVNDDTGDFLRSLCNYLNHELNVFQPKIEKVDGDSIFLENGIIFTARGWGYLTGVLKLSSEEAAKVQDEFIGWVVYRITNSFFDTNLTPMQKLDIVSIPRPVESVEKARLRKSKSISDKLKELKVKFKTIKK